jgi:LysM repeat protein
MGSVRRAGRNGYLRYLGLNVLVSAATILFILFLWGRRGGTPSLTPTPTFDVAALIASKVPTVTATIPPSPTPATYTVKSGDTLFSISLELGIPVDALMAANGLTDPDRLSTGQVLTIPAVEVSGGGTPSPGAPQPVQVTATPPPAKAQAPRVRIVSVDGAGLLDNESVLLRNDGGVAAMAGWTLEDGQGQVFVFPVFTLYSGAVRLHTKGGTDTVIDLYWGLTQAVWTPGKTITLRDSSGAVQSTFKIPS